MSASPWRVLSGYTTYQRPHEKAFWGERGTLDTDRPRRSPFCWAVAHRGGAYLKSPQIKIATKPPIFLKGMTWVDFRNPDLDPMKQLSWGITGEHV